MRVPHPCRVFATEPALGEAEGMGLQNALRLLLYLVDNATPTAGVLTIIQSAILGRAIKIS